MKRPPGHSPLPWAIEKLEDGDYAIIDATGEIIAEPDYGDDARLIVAAVNAHADLIGTAKRMANYWTLENCKALEAAIAKAEQA